MNQHTTHSRTYVAISYVLLALTALLLRVVDLGGFVNEDEIQYWLPRSQKFLYALQTGDFGATAISTHPGVTTMWLGSIGIVLRRALRAWEWVDSVPFPLRLALMRVPTALVHTTGILAGYWFMRRMLPATVALLAAFLWATNPFTIGFSRILHVDGLAMTFATLSILAACYYWNYAASVRWLVVSAICGGLAILSKSPALVVVPVIGLLGIVSGRDRHSSTTKRQDTSEQPEQDEQPRKRLVTRELFLESLRSLRSLRFTTLSGRRLWPRLARLLLWGCVYIATLLVVWPAFWSDPMRVYDLLRIGVEVEGANPHVQGNYFLGREDNEPGVLFYPVALALRTTPWTLVGLLLLPLATLPGLNRESLRSLWFIYDPESRHAHLRTLAVLAVFVVLFIAGLSIFPKKLNRYIIPITPAVDILAAYGLVWGASLGVHLIPLLAEYLNRKGRKGRKGRKDRTAGQCDSDRHCSHGFGIMHRRTDAQSVPFAGSMLPSRGAVQVIVGVLVVMATINAIWYHPYGITYFNQLLGGPPMGRWTFLTGSGEGLEQVAAWLNEQPDITGVVTVATMPPPLQPYLKHRAYAGPPDGTKLPDNTGYVVVYVRNVWGHALPPFDQFYQRVLPVYSVTLHGVDYAWVYQVPQPLPHRLQAEFGPAVSLHSYDIDSTALRSSGVVSLTLQWQAREPVPQDYMLFVHILDDAGQQVAHIDVPPGGPTMPTHTWHPHGYVSWVHPVPVPANLPAGRYWLSLGLYDPATFARVPLHTPTTYEDAPNDGPDTLFLKPMTLHLSTE